jgi:hypothetical protein
VNLSMSRDAISGHNSGVGVREAILVTSIIQK